MDILEKIDLFLNELSSDLRPAGTAVAGKMVQSPVERYKAEQAAKMRKKKKKETDNQTSQTVAPANTYPFQSK